MARGRGRTFTFIGRRPTNGGSRRWPGDPLPVSLKASTTNEKAPPHPVPHPIRQVGRYLSAEPEAADRGQLARSDP